jgi:hypothetical protein
MSGRLSRAARARLRLAVVQIFIFRLCTSRLRIVIAFGKILIALCEKR